LCRQAEAVPQTPTEICKQQEQKKHQKRSQQMEDTTTLSVTKPIRCIVKLGLFVSLSCTLSNISVLCLTNCFYSHCFGLIDLYWCKVTTFSVFIVACFLEDIFDLDLKLGCDFSFQYASD